MLSFFNLKTLLKLLGQFKFGAARAYDVKSTRVAILVDDVGCEFHVVVVHESARTHEETKEAAVLVQGLDAIKDTTNHIVATRSLTTRENHTHVKRLAHACGALGVLLKE